MSLQQSILVIMVKSCLQCLTMEEFEVCFKKICRQANQFKRHSKLARSFGTYNALG